MKRPSILALSLIAALALAAGCSPEQGERSRERAQETTRTAEDTTTRTAPQQGGLNTSDTYRVRLEEVNDSGVTGEATVTVEGSAIEVVMRAEGLAPGEAHPAHIHGFRDGQPSRTPPDRSDLTDVESEKAIGPVLIALVPYPEANEQGDIAFEGTFEDVQMFFALDNRAIQVHGTEVDGDYDFTVPVAVGLLEPVSGTEGFNQGTGGTGGSLGETGTGGPGGMGGPGGSGGSLGETGTGGPGGSGGWRDAPFGPDGGMQQDGGGGGLGGMGTEDRDGRAPGDMGRDGPGGGVTTTAP